MDWSPRQLAVLAGPHLHKEQLLFPEGQLPQLKIESWARSALTVLIRGFTRHGTFSFDHTTASDRSRTTTTHALPDYPIWLQARTNVTGQERGNVFVKITIQLAGFDVGQVCAGYISASKILTYPPVTIEDARTAPVQQFRVTGTDPAAGAEISESVPTNAKWNLRAFRATLVTDATVANRMFKLVLDDAVNELHKSLNNSSITATSTTECWGSPTGQITQDGVVDIIALIPEWIVLGSGFRIRTETKNLQAGDNWGAPDMFVEEFLAE